MSAGRRQALEIALRRTLEFHLGADVEDQYEQLVFALLDAAEEGGLRDCASVAREVEDYLPDASSIGLPSSSSQKKRGEGEEGAEEEVPELYEDVLRSAPGEFRRTFFDDLAQQLRICCLL